MEKASVVKDLARKSIALTIAGFDPSSGAGVTADLQVFRNHGIHGVASIAAITVQSTRSVRRIEPVSRALLQESLDCLVGDMGIDGVKIGMLGTAEAVGAVADFLRRAGIPKQRVVLDPVIRASSGAELLESAGVRRLVAEMLPMVGWVTPNLDEAAALLGEEVAGRDGIPDQARRIAALGGTGQGGSGLNVVVTGGHLDPPDDFLRTAGGEERWFPGVRMESRSIHGTHGTGCVFSSALLCRLLLGDGAAEAVAGAKAAVVRRLQGE